MSNVDIYISRKNSNVDMIEAKPAHKNKEVQI